MTTFDDQDIELDFFEEPETVESPQRRGGPRRSGPRRPGSTPPATVAAVRLAGFVVLAIAVIVGIAAAVSGSKSNDGYVSYMDGVRPLAQSSARVGAAFADELAAPNLTLATLETKLRSWSQEEQRDYDSAQRLRPPGQLHDVHQQLLATLQLRALGLAGLANVLQQAKSSDAPAVATRLAGQAQLFSASDIVWSELYRLPAIQILKDAGVTGVIVPTSQFVANPEVISSSSFGLVYQRLQPASSGTGGTVTGLHGSALVSTAAVAGGQTTTLSTSTPSTIVMAQGLALHVTFEDSGNFTQVNVPVTLKVTIGGSTVYSKTQTVATVATKQQATVSFTGLQVPNDAFGHSATVTATVGKVAGEKNLDNNTATYPVFFSLAQG